MATAKELKDFFNKFGNVKNVEKLKRKPTQEKGTAYITFSSPKSLDKVLDETKGSTVFKGLTINIEAAKASVQAAAQKKNGGNRDVSPFSLYLRQKSLEYAKMAELSCTHPP